ncbi:uncharacterized protein LOC131597897 [Vicia villosa]|uniref:uncharacterized protein LOC131597897 n=1 Tax=Vicia villosa TaxID=3911 RepID=UPI00273B0655|nr:uncharacterized protein LOC131597897 [Vicia villosa]
MDGRNNVVIAAALDAMAQALENQPNMDENVGSRSLATFQRETLCVFKCTYDPDGAMTWLKEIERIFRVMHCTPEQKVWYGTHMLTVEADDWWLENRQRLEVAGEEVTWAVFRREFLRKYFLVDVRGKKEIEFVELKQGSMSVTTYAAEFGELAKFYQHYDGPNGEFSKCIKFENKLRPEIKKAISYQKIRVFGDLVDGCRIYEEDNIAQYKMISEKRNKNHQNRGKPYDAPAGKGKSEVAEGCQGHRSSGGDSPANVTCFKCGKPGYKINVFTTEVKRCFRCGKFGHAQPECKHKEVICFNCGEEGHISSLCQKPKKAQIGGKVLTLVGDSDN